MIGYWYDTLPDLISSVGQQQFYSQVERCFNAIQPISKFKIFSYPKADKPQVLGGNDQNELDHIYCESAYLLDPFYDVICRQERLELVTLDSITRHDFESSAYYDRFYHRLGWTNETNFIVNVNNERTICLVYTAEETTVQQLNNALSPYLKSIKAAIRKHEELSTSLINHFVSLTPHHAPSLCQNQLDSRLDLFGLTRREKEIVDYILRGYPSPAIAQRCFVSEGTVKNHRKNIYRKLHIKSQCELFSKFMN